MKYRFFKFVSIAIVIAAPIAAYAAYSGPTAAPTGNNTPGAVWLSPSTVQTGTINVSSDVQTGNNFIVSDGKAINTPVNNGNSNLYISNYAATNPTGFTANIRGDLNINGFGSVTTGTLRVPTICLNGTCRNSWPTGSGGTIGGSGTQYYIPIFSAGTSLGNSTIYQNGTNVGIGTTGANGKLTLSNNVATGFLDTYPEYQEILYDGGSAGASYGLGIKGNTMVFNSGAGAYSFDRGGNATTLTMDTAGNVGIGTAAPVSKLDVAGLVHSGGGSSAISSQGAYIGWNGLTGGTGETDIINNPGGGPGGIAFMLANAAGTSKTTSMFINSAGNVGIGTTSPGHRLSVFATAAEDGLQLDAPTYPEIQFSRSGAVKGYLGVAGSAGGYAAGSLADSVILRSENALHFVSNGGTMGPTVYNGNLGIGITTPGSPLEVQGIRSGTHSAVMYGRDNLTGYELYGLSQNASLIASGPNSTYVELAGITGGVYGRAESTYGTGMYGYGNGAGTGGYSATSYGVGGHFENTYDAYNYNTADLGGYGYGLTAVGTNYGVRSDSANYSFYGNSGKLYNAGNAMFGTLSNNSLITLGIGDSDTGLHSAGDGALDVYSNGIRTMSVRSGNVGLGTNDPYLAGMSNTLAVSRGAGGIYGLGMSYAGPWYMSIITEGQKRINIMDGGNIGIGTTSPGAPLDIQTTSNIFTTGYAYFAISGTSAISGYSSNQTAPYSLRTSGRILAGGEVNVTSDLREKNILNRLSDGDALDKILRLSPVEYTWKYKNDSAPHLGFIAQEVGPVIPQAVTVLPGKIDGKDVNDFHVLDYNEITPVVVGAVKEQQKEIESLKAQNAELLKRLEALEARVK